MYINISYICVDWTKPENDEWEIGVSGDDVCDCSSGDLLDKKPFGPLYIFKHVFRNN
jgi:hypothetical protein